MARFTQAGTVSAAPVEDQILKTCNLALSRVGVSIFIEDMDESSQEAAVCRNVWERCYEDTLAAFPWSFAKKIAALVRVTDGLGAIEDPNPGWAFKYIYPADCLFLRSLQTDYAPPDPYFWPISLLLSHKIIYDVSEDESRLRKVINCNIDGAYAVYTARIASSYLWEPLFKDALAWAVAAEISAPLNKDSGKQQTAINMFRQALHTAAARSMNENREEEPECDLLAGRR